MSQKQRTFTWCGEKVTIKSRPKLWHGNPIGYAVSINGKSHHVNALTREEAEGHVFKKWATERPDIDHE